MYRIDFKKDNVFSRENTETENREVLPGRLNNIRQMIQSILLIIISLL